MEKKSESEHRPIFRIDPKLLEEEIKHAIQDYDSLKNFLGDIPKEYRGCTWYGYTNGIYYSPYRTIKLVICAYDAITNAFVNPENIRYYSELKSDIEELRRFRFLLEQNPKERRGYLSRLLNLDKDVTPPRENIKRILQYFPLLVMEVRNLYPKEDGELLSLSLPPNQESKQEQGIEPKETVIPVEVRRKDTEIIKKLEEVKETLSSLKYTSEATCLKLKNLSPKLREFGAEDLESACWRLVFEIEDNLSPSRSLHEDNVTPYRMKIIKFLDNVKNRLELYEEDYLKATKKY
jgi:hypothetical protein